MENGDDTDFAIAQPAPIDEVPLVAEEIALNAELGRDGAGDWFVAFDLLEAIEQASDIAVCPGRASSIPGVAVDFAKPA